MGMFKKIIKWGLISTGTLTIGIIALAVVFSGGGGGETNTVVKTNEASAGNSNDPAQDSTEKATEAIASEPKKNKQTKQTEQPKQTEKTKQPKMTLAQQNAVRAAKNYIEYTAFSKEGLIKQLEFEKYSTKHAKFAVNHIDVNWKKQAVKAAKNYIEYTSFSRQGLINQLEFEGYTTKQATYAVNKIGL